MAKLDDGLEAAFLRNFAERLGLEELSEAALATSLGFDELTAERLDQWFVEMALAGRRGGRPRSPQDAKVVQVDDEPNPQQPVPDLRSLRSSHGDGC